MKSAEKGRDKKGDEIRREKTGQKKEMKTAEKGRDKKKEMKSVEKGRDKKGDEIRREKDGRKIGDEIRRKKTRHVSKKHSCKCCVQKKDYLCRRKE